MDAADLLAFFDRPIAFHRVLVDVCESVTGAILLSQAIYWQRVKERQGDTDQWFYKTGKEWLEETGMRREEFQTARRKLVEAGVLKYELRGMPARCFYQVQAEVLSLRLSSNPVCGNPANKNAGTPPTGVRESRKLPNITTESSSKTTPESVAAEPPTPAPKAKKAKPIKTPIPDAFKASERVLKWATGKKLLPTYVQACVESFMLHCQANGSMYVDWDAALINWIHREPQFSKQPPAIDRTDHSDKQCRWTNQGKEQRCRENGTIHMGAGQYLCAKHHRMVQEREEQRKTAGATT